MNKLIIPIIVIVVVAAGIGAYFVFHKPASEPQTGETTFPQPTPNTSATPTSTPKGFTPEAGKCGDGICDDLEKANPNACPGDCQQTTPTPITPIAPATKDSPFALHDPQVLMPPVDTVSAVAETGAKWVRYAGGQGIVWGFLEPQKGQFNWKNHDAFYLETYNAGFKMFVTIMAVNKAYGDTEPGRLPKDMNAYLSFLKKTVERYDGDGIDDASGSPVVDIWQIDNEPDLMWKDSKGDYAKLLKESYKIIKQASPKSKVAIAGVGGPQGFDGAINFYVPLLKELAKIQDNPTDRYFDVFDFHWYPFSATSQYNRLTETPLKGVPVIYLKSYIQNINNTLAKYGYNNIPIFITEAAQYDGTPAESEFHSEKKQALDLFKIYAYSLANGVKKIFWVTLTEWHNFGQANSVFDNVGLINNSQNDGQSHKKLAYYTYKKMTEILEGSNWNNLQTVQEQDGIYIYKFTKSGKLIWVAWNDNSAEKQITISGITSSQVKITEAIPKYESGKEVTDYNTAFKTETKNVSNGAISMMLKDVPMFIEKQ